MMTYYHKFFISFSLIFFINNILHIYAIELDKYGGWKERRYDNTGFFRLQKIEGKDWLITPDGHPFLINQLDHVNSFKLRADYNKGYWAKKFGIDPNAPKKVWDKNFEEKVLEDQKNIGFNTIHHTKVPGIAYIGRFTNLSIAYYTKNIKPENFIDPFSPTFKNLIEHNAKKIIEPVKNDPWLIGWHLRDSPILNDYDAQPKGSGYYHKTNQGSVTWPLRIRNLGEQSEGKKVYVQIMKKRYTTIEAFNDTYCTDFNSWNQLLKAENWKPKNDYLGNFREEKDNHAFLLKILDQAFKVKVAAIKKFDPNHLIIGDRINCNSVIHDDVLKVFAKHFDILSFQFYGTWEDFSPLMERLHRVTGKPLHSADSSFNVVKENMPNPLGIVCVNQDVRANQFKECYYNSYKLPYFIGWGWCGWMDALPSLEPDMQHAGIQDPYGNYDQPIVNDMLQFSKDMYLIHQQSQSF